MQNVPFVKYFFMQVLANKKKCKFMKKVFLFLTGALLMVGCNQDELLTSQDQKQLLADQAAVFVNVPFISEGSWDGDSELRLGFNTVNGKLLFETGIDVIGFYPYEGMDMGLPSGDVFKPFAPSEVFKFQYNENKYLLPDDAEGDRELFVNMEMDHDFEIGAYAAFHPYNAIVNTTTRGDGTPLVRIDPPLKQRQEASDDFSHLKESVVMFSSVMMYDTYTKAATAHVIGEANKALNFQVASTLFYVPLEAVVFEGGSSEKLLNLKVNAVKAGAPFNIFNEIMYGVGWVDMEDFVAQKTAAPDAAARRVLYDWNLFQYFTTIPPYAKDQVLLLLGEEGEMGCNIPADGKFNAMISVVMNPAIDLTDVDFVFTLRTTEGFYEFTRSAPTQGYFTPGAAYRVEGEWSELQEIKWTEGCFEPVDEVDGVYSIYSPCELAWIAEECNKSMLPNDFSGKVIKLMNNLDLGGETDQNWTPIGLPGSANRFRGTFEGGGHLIKNLYIAGNPGEYVGLFGYNQGDIKDINISGVEITGGAQGAGGVAGVNIKTISGCTVEGLNISGVHVGGIAGVYTYAGVPASITGCAVTGTEDANSINATQNAGGIAGLVNGGASVKENTASVNVTSNNNAGGIVGFSDHANNLVVNCSFSGEVKGTNAGGVVGDNAGTIEQCAIGAMGASVDETTIIATTNGGGIVGTNAGTVVACANPGVAVTSSANAGGVAGNNDGLIAVCYYAADGNTLQATLNGGIAGKNELGGEIQSVVTNITNSAAAGICGSNAGTIGNGVARGAAYGTISSYDVLEGLTIQSLIESALAPLNGGTASKFRRSVIEPEWMYEWTFNVTSKKFNIKRVDYEEIIVASNEYPTAASGLEVWVPARYAMDGWVTQFYQGKNVVKTTVNEVTKLSNRTPVATTTNYYNYQGRAYGFTNTENTDKWAFSAQLYVTPEMMANDTPFMVSFWGDASGGGGSIYPIIAAANTITDGIYYQGSYLPQDINTPQWKWYNSDTGEWAGDVELTPGWHDLKVTVSGRTITYWVDGNDIGSYTVDPIEGEIILKQFMFLSYNFAEVLDGGVPVDPIAYPAYDITGYSFDAYFANASVSLFAK